MAPHEVLLSSLGGCTAMTLLLYARRKGWALERVEASLVHEKPPAGSGEAPETIDVELRLEGALDAVQREKLLEIAQRCPVHRTLRHGVTIRERLLS
jgi:putative redox protein